MENIIVIGEIDATGAQVPQLSKMYHSQSHWKKALMLLLDTTLSMEI